MFQSLRLSGLVPSTLPEDALQTSEVWNTLLEVKRGEHVLVSAASGKGKSTFISILYGLRTDFSGSYVYNGADSRGMDASLWSTIRSEEMSIVFQDLRLFPELSVADNLRVKANLNPSGFQQEEVEVMCRRLGVAKYLGRKCGTLSFGERQRVAIVRALVPKAGLVLMDEPFSHLDRENTEIALGLILEKCAESNAALVITSLGQDFGWKYDRILSL